MKNIHVLTTNKPSSLYFEDNNSELIFLKGYFVHKTFNIKPQNIYITSDEEIKEGDWYIFPLYKKGFTIKRYNSVEHFSKEPCISLANLKAKKIILTTDQDLIKDGVQSIDDEFLEWFVKNPSCEEVKVDKFISEIYFCTNPIITKEEPKQETAEQAAERLIPTVIGGTPLGLFEWEPRKERKSFIKGAKWQQEQWEEDLKEAFSMGRLGKTDMSFKEWFEKFKNK